MREFFLTAVLPFAAVVACAPAPPRVASAVSGLPEYTPEDSLLFDDVLGPEVFDLPTSVRPTDDDKFAPRVKLADALLPVRVGTVTAETMNGKSDYTVLFTVQGPPLAGRPVESPIELHFPRGSASSTSIARLGDGLVGHRLLLLLRRYDDQGEPKVHFHGLGDDAVARQAVDREKTLDAAAAKAQKK
jgi:hypothetical protein